MTNMGYWKQFAVDGDGEIVWDLQVDLISNQETYGYLNNIKISLVHDRVNNVTDAYVDGARLGISTLAELDDFVRKYVIPKSNIKNSRGEEWLNTSWQEIEQHHLEFIDEAESVRYKLDMLGL